MILQTIKGAYTSKSELQSAHKKIKSEAISVEAREAESNNQLRLGNSGENTVNKRVMIKKDKLAREKYKEEGREDPPILDTERAF